MSRSIVNVGVRNRPSPTSLKKFFEELSSRNGFECKKLYYENDTYYCVRDILKCLKYGDEKYDISKILKKLQHLDKFTIIQLQEKYNYTKDNDPNKGLINSLSKYQMKQIYINNDGIKELLSTIIQPIPSFLLDMCKILNIDINRKYIRKDLILKNNKGTNLANI